MWIVKQKIENKRNMFMFNVDKTFLVSIVKSLAETLIQLTDRMSLRFIFWAWTAPLHSGKWLLLLFKQGAKAESENFARFC